ncbi:MAG: phosphoribosylformylglycinamidine synthase subunit PurQ, partial [Erysipelotrichaceae bacterium]|nr:phosphoribosylformylglycinamidine synthase subunit PurQ [Erysipelotrichaceae bacterium]
TDKVFKAKELCDEVHVLIPVFPGTNCEFDVARAFEEEGAKAHIFVFRNLNEEAILTSIDEMAALMDKCQIFAIPGGFSSGDEPDGSAKFIVNVLQNEKIKAAVSRLRERDGLILGICNGFQALIKSGLLPYGEIKTMKDDDCTLYRNDINRHVSTMVTTRQVTNNSPWLANATVGEVHSIAVSHGEGKFVCDEAHLKHLIENGLIAFQYCDLAGNATMDAQYCVNGSTYAIEGIVSDDGHVLGKMGHSERYVEGVFKNIEGLKKQGIFKNGVNYFKK